MWSRLSCLRNRATSLSSLYTSGQCFLSVLGSIGVILLFAGIPQIIYSAHVNPTNLLTFILGAVLVTLMVAGNAFIGHKYRQLIRSRREQDRPHRNEAALRDDKPPSYDDLVKQDGLPPEYDAAIKDNPPIYSDLVHEVMNWQTISAYPYSTSYNRESCKPNQEVSFLVPIHRAVDHLRASTSSATKIKRASSSKEKSEPNDPPKQPEDSSHSSQIPPHVLHSVESTEPSSTADSEDGTANDFVEIRFYDEETYF